MVSAAADFSQGQMGEVRMDAVAGQDVNYHGLDPAAVLTHIAEGQAKERQYRRLEAADADRRYDQVDRRLDRIDLVLQRVALILALEAGVLALLLIAALVLIGALLSPHLVAATAVAGAGLIRLIAGGKFS